MTTEGVSYNPAGNTVKGYSSMYNGNRDPFAMKSPFSRGQVFIEGKRRRLNIVGILVSFFVPWLLFCFVYAVLSFQLRYAQPTVSYILVALAFLAGPAYTTGRAVRAFMSRETNPAYQPSWYIFLAGTTIVAFALGVAVGGWNYTNYMQPYYDLNNLAEYKNIDTNEYLGQQLMDAGRIEFKKGTVLDLGRSMGFKSHDVYCVSPILTKGSATESPSVDFWAVGKNCCSGVSADFHCPGFSDPHATGSLRMMHDADRPLYRLAVQQAEATYKLTAGHPLFFTWVHNADEAVDEFARKGYLHFVLGVCSYFLLQAFLVLSASLAFAKLVHV